MGWCHGWGGLGVMGVMDNGDGRDLLLEECNG